MKKTIKKMIWVIVIFLLIGIPSCVYADDEIEEEENELEMEEVSSNLVEEPQLNSRAAVVLDRTSMKVLWGKESGTRRPMASTTKIMTAIVVLENGKLTDTVEISKKAAGTGGSRLGLKAGDKVTVNDLLYGLMMRSGNDSAVALAEYIGGSVEGFADKMNQKVRELGLKNTNFVTPHGLDMPEHYTTAYELALMADYGLKNKKFAEIVNTKTCTIAINSAGRTLSNTNELLGNLNGVYGVKTGFTNGANRCLVTSVKRDDLDLITVVLGADTKKFRTTDSVKMIEYTYKNYQMYPIREKILEEFKTWKEINEKRILVNKGTKSGVELELEPLLLEKIPIKVGQEKDLKVEINCLEYMETPIEKGQIVGTLILRTNSEKLLTMNILVKNDVGRKNVWDYFLFLTGNQKEYLEKSLSF